MTHVDTMRVALGQLHELSDGDLTFARQLGASGIQLNTPVLPGDKRWEVADLRWLRQRCESFGLRLEAIENTPTEFYEKAMLGLPGRDEQIEHYQATIRHLGAAGIPVLGYHWMPLKVWRTTLEPGRGGALASAFDLSRIDSHPLVWGIKEHPLLRGREITADELWDNYVYFMKAVLPVAEEVGVKLALHPDDPPVPSLGGVARIFSTFEGFRRAMEVLPSPSSGLDFCMGCWSEMAPATLPGVVEAMRYFGQRQKIFYVHFRDVQGTGPRFVECFLGEGNVDVAAAIRVLVEVNFTGFILDDHVPRIVDDTTWGHRGRALATGYIMGLIKGVAAAAVPARV